MKRMFKKVAAFVLLAALILTYLPIASAASYKAKKEWDGKSELENRVYYTVKSEYRLFHDLDIPEGAALEVSDGGALILTSGMKLIANGELIVDIGGRIDAQHADFNIAKFGTLDAYGRINISPKSTLNISSEGTLNILAGGILEIYGTLKTSPTAYINNRNVINLMTDSDSSFACRVNNGKFGKITVDGFLVNTQTATFNNKGSFIVNKTGSVRNSGTFILEKGSKYVRDGYFINSSKAFFYDLNITGVTIPKPEPEKVILAADKFTAKILKDEPEKEILGIDVSFWQADIDWKKVAASGVKFAILRVGHGRVSAERGMFEDSYFKTNAAGAVAAGIDVGVYFYSTAHNASEAESEAKFVLEIIKNYEITYPVVFDIEDPMHEKMTKSQITAITEAFLNVIADGGYYPMIYSYKNFLEAKIEQSVLDTYAVWLAQWSAAPTYDNDFYIWQFSAKGIVPGINGDVDLNYSYRDFPEILRKNGLNNLK